MSEKIMLELESQELQIVLNALGELPYRVSVSVINNILSQVRKQQQESQISQSTDKTT